MKLESLIYGYEALALTPESRARLLKRFPPKFPKVIAHHVTYRFGVPESVKHPPGINDGPTPIEVIGYASDDRIEAVLVKVNGTSKRPDGKLFHVTLSLDPTKGAKPAMSNDLLAGGHTKVPSLTIEGIFSFFR